MNKSLASPDTIQSPEELLQGICASTLLPDENADDFDYLREALFEDLRPQTRLEQLRAEQLVDLEWDRLRCRRWRDNILKTAVRYQADIKLKMSKIDDEKITPEVSKEHADGLVSLDPNRRQAALTTLQQRDVSIQEVVAVAYSIKAKELAAFERQLVEMETRRRKLFEDYDRIRASRKPQIEDAEEIEDIEP